MWVLFIALIIVIAVIVKGKGLWAARTRNSIISWATGQEGLCCECKHCRHDPSRRFSDTDYYCSISKCKHITEETKMRCFEKPKVTEGDLQELFKLGIWTELGKQYIRKSILGKAMTWTELDDFLKQLPIGHPEYIDQKKKEELSRQ